MPTLFVTGANRGLGFEFARQYAADGWRVVGTARDLETAGALRDVGAEVHALDVTDAEATHHLATGPLAALSIDLLIANAGISGPREMTPERVDAAAWMRTLAVNTIAPLSTVGAFLPHLKRGEKKMAVAISSRLGSIGFNTRGGLYAYRSSKAGLNAAWRSLAVDQPDLVAVVFHPGWVRTDMGGAGADLGPDESVSNMRRVIARLRPADTGHFFDQSGDEIPW